MSNSAVPAPEAILKYATDLTFEHFGFGNSIDERIINIDLILRNSVLHSGSVQSSRSEPAAPTGLLAYLPLELLQAIVLQLDLWSVTSFRAVSWYTYSIVDRNFQYANIKEQVTHVLPALLKTGAASWISLDSLYRYLQNCDCVSCGDFGPFLYLLTCERVCSICFSSKPQYAPLIQSEIKRLYQTPAKILRLLPKLRSLPGTYSDEDKVWSRRVTLFDRTAVEMATRGSQSMCFNRKADADISTQVDHLGGSNPYRFMAIQHVPWFDRERDKFEQGLSCQSCADSSVVRDLDDEYGSGQDEYAEEDVDEDANENADANEIQVGDRNMGKDQKEMVRRLDWRTIHDRWLH